MAGVFNFGGINSFPQGRGDTGFQYTDILSWVKGRHALKFGAEFRRFRNNNFNYGTGGTITFPTLAQFLAGTPSVVQQLQLPATPALRVNAFNWFVQDDYKVIARLTLNLGLRWEYNGARYEVSQGPGRAYNSNVTNFGPRVGFAYDPLGKGNTVIRGGFGLYYDQPVTNVVTRLGAIRRSLAR